MPAPDGKVAHAELQIGDSIVMLTEATQEPVTSASIYLYVPNADATFERAVAAGAQTNMPVTDIFWGTGSVASSTRSVCAGESRPTRRMSRPKRSTAGPHRR